MYNQIVNTAQKLNDPNEMTLGKVDDDLVYAKPKLPTNCLVDRLQADLVRSRPTSSPIKTPIEKTSSSNSSDTMLHKTALEHNENKELVESTKM